MLTSAPRIQHHIGTFARCCPLFFEMDRLPSPHVHPDMLDKLEAEETTELDGAADQRNGPGDQWKSIGRVGC